MRIVCPRCVAQYEVDESAIPEEGREVQCANCDHIWFQDYIVMLPESPDDEAHTTDDALFEDLDGITETQFQSARAEPALDDAPAPGDPQNILADDADDDLADSDDDDLSDDDVPGDVALPPVADNVREVLQSEAAFSSARAKIDAAAATALDAGSDAAADTDAALWDDGSTPDDTTKAPADAPPPDDDDLAAFLAAHTEDADTTVEEPVPAVADTSADDPADDVLEDADEDPLADLAAMRSQLDQIEDADDADEVGSLYTPNVPQDDPPEDDDVWDDVAADEDPVDDGAGDDDFDDVDSDTDAADTDRLTSAIVDALDDDPTDAAADDMSSGDDDDLVPASADDDAADLLDDPDDDPFADDFDDLDDDDDDDEEPRRAFRADAVLPGDEDTAADDDLDDPVEESPPPDVMPAGADVSESIRRALDPSDGGDTPDDPDEDEAAPEDDASDEIAAGILATPEMRRPKSRSLRARTIPGFEPSRVPPPDDADPALPEEPLAVNRAFERLGQERVPAQGVRRPRRLDSALLPTEPEATPEPEETVVEPESVEPVEPAEEQVEEVASADATDNDAKSEGGRALLPDVDELSDSLQNPENGSSHPREMLTDVDGYSDGSQASGGGFRRALIWTLFIFALFMALYVMRPQILAAVPSLAVVLDPYAAVIDQIRLAIDGLLAG